MGLLNLDSISVLVAVQNMEMMVGLFSTEFYVIIVCTTSSGISHLCTIGMETDIVISDEIDLKRDPLKYFI